MKQTMPRLVILTTQPLGCMFPTTDLIQIIIQYITCEVLEDLVTIYPEPLSLLSSLVWDSRQDELPVVLQGDETSQYESEEDDT
jgi:hypothetical protein